MPIRIPASSTLPFPRRRLRPSPQWPPAPRASSWQDARLVEICGEYVRANAESKSDSISTTFVPQRLVAPAPHWYPLMVPASHVVGAPRSRPLPIITSEACRPPARCCGSRGRRAADTAPEPEHEQIGMALVGVVEPDGGAGQPGIQQFPKSLSPAPTWSAVNTQPSPRYTQLRPRCRSRRCPARIRRRCARVAGAVARVDDHGRRGGRDREREPEG